jgi:hypothetical protein
MIRQLDRARWQRWIAVFATLLITGLSLIQAIHLHEELAPSSAAHSHCALCIFSHSPAVVTSARHAPIATSGFATLAPADAQLRSRLVVPSAFIRPPPAL